jgi:N-acetylglutamate synthase-like GNAT family acetyltransferase
VQLRFASLDDTARIQDFIDSYWKKNHILSRDVDLITWQHGTIGDRLNFVLCEERDEVLGLLGFIDSSQFDGEIPEPSITLTTWLARSDVRTTGVGVALVRFLMRNCKSQFFSTIGVAVEAQALLGVLGYKTGEMAHHVVFNPDCSEYRIFSGQPHSSPHRGSSPRTSTIVEDFEDSSVIDQKLLDRHNAVHWPMKSRPYLDARFVNHPRYRYKIIRFLRDGEDRSLLICREILANDSRMLRCVDSVGSLLDVEMVGRLTQLLADNGAEYLELHSHSAESLLMTDAGFVDARSDGVPHLPGYFEPFTTEPRILRYAHWSPSASSLTPHLFLADSDQDRPNQ